ncbi:helix-turn-helix domain-containing protein [Christiangramia sp. LLG6405-1]|uniref:helix-turn-helix domain-containing protein n=1 Tax=Christiangramia sp. LLG6405-1 TaxID=3160832 RepID=UPI00386B5089
MKAIAHIGKLIQQRRDHMRITQEQLAEMADIGIITLYKIETGQANPTLKSLQKITDVLGLEINLQVKKIQLK